MPLSVAYVLPRYGAEVVGGAELAIRLIAERLVGATGWDVSVLTTCALDSRTWANHYPEGEADVNGVRVHRFATAQERDPAFDELSNRVLLGSGVTRDEQQRWIDLQGPFSPDLLNAVAASEADVLIFKPYLYYPTVRGVPLVQGRPGRAVLMHPAAHDEPALRLPLLRSVFLGCDGYVFNMVGERRLLESVWPETASRKGLVSGFGIEPPAPGDDAGPFCPSPYLVSVGRVDESKGSLLLASWFAAYKERRPGPLKLVLIGQVADRPVEHPDIVLAGIVDDGVKWGALRGAAAVVQPSPFESLSLALLEGMAVARPTLVNAACAATTEHVRRSGGGFAIRGYAEFEVVLDRLLGDPALSSSLGSAGLAYVEQFYRWPRILENYQRFVEGFF